MNQALTTAAPKSEATAPLAGVRVADFGRHIAGPYCAALLGDLGAEVVRVERKGGGEDRWLLPLSAGPGGEPGEGAGFVQCNRNKKSIALDPTSHDGRDVVRRLIGWADVIVANLPPSGLEAMGLGWDEVHAQNPRVILVSASTFGSTGPYAERLGFDGIAQVMSGSVWLSGQPDRPMRTHATWVDFSTAAFSTIGALAALRQRGETGRGQHVETSLLLTALNVFNPYLMEQAVTRAFRQPHGARAHTSGPADLHRCRDGWIMIAVVGNAMFRRWVKLLGEPQWLEDPRYATDRSRGEHSATLSERMDAWCAERTVAEAVETLNAAKLPCGPVYDLEQALNDPHVKAAGMFRQMTLPGLTVAAPVAASPVRLSDAPARMERAPLAGEHTDAILIELGYDTLTIDRLRAAGVV